jgi:hypothetical protein
VSQLQVVEECGCDRAGCASFYTVEGFHARWLWGRGGRTLTLGPGLAVDVVGNRILAVEVINLPDLRIPPNANPSNARSS